MTDTFLVGQTILFGKTHYFFFILSWKAVFLHFLLCSLMILQVTHLCDVMTNFTMNIVSLHSSSFYLCFFYLC